MKHCDHCNIDIVNPRDICPLCQSTLSSREGTEKESFPFIPTAYQAYGFMLRLLIFLSVVTVVVSLVINYFSPDRGWWSLIVLAALAYFWINVINILRTHNSLFSISNSVIVLSVLLLIIDVLYDYQKWSVNYVIPALLLAAMAAVVIISLIRGLRFSEFLIYLIITAAFAIMPLIFLLTGMATVVWPSLSCILAGLLSLIAVVVFADEATRNELKRRFHL